MKLSERDVRTLGALADTLLPEGGPLPSARAVDVAGGVRQTIARLPDAQVSRLVALIRGFSAITWGAGGRRFRNLSPRGRDRVVARLGRQHGYRGQAFAALKQLLVTTWASHPDVAAAMGVEAGCLADSADHRAMIEAWLPAPREG